MSVEPHSFLVEVVAEPRTLWMLVAGPTDDPESLFHSNYALQVSPHPDAKAATALYMALSMWDEAGIPRMLVISDLAPRLGSYVAEVTLRPGRPSKPTGICIADTVEEGHWSVWGTPRQLARGLADIKPASSFRH